MSNPDPDITESKKFAKESLSQTEKLRSRQRRNFTFALIGSTFAFLLMVSFLKGPAVFARWAYEPQAGDIIFQSLPPNPLVNAIEGVTQSSFSHCGIVVKNQGKFYVCEAFDSVELSPLNEFLTRGRREGFAVYRLKSDYRKQIPAIATAAKAYLGRPYDVRYRMDAENIYCSELIYKAWTKIFPNDQLGSLRKLGEMNWKPFQETIRFYEQGPVPLDREMITPVDLALADQLEFYYSFRIKTPTRDISGE